MSIQDQNKNIVRRWVKEYLSTGDESVAMALTAPDSRLYFPGYPEPLVRDEAKAVLPALRIGFPDLRFHIEEMSAEGDKVFARLLMEGTHRGEFQGMPPTNRSAKLRVLVEFRLRDGKIIEDRPIFDRLDMLEQLGVISIPMKAKMVA
jgi:steroid delta-isomerase-like uncharacterized protein